MAKFLESDSRNPAALMRAVCSEKRTDHIDLQPRRMIEEQPRQLESFCEVGGQSFDPKSFGRVVSAIQDVEAEILG